MKVVVRSSSLVFTLLSIIFHVPITRVKRQTSEKPKVPVPGSRDVAQALMHAASTLVSTPGSDKS